MSEEKWYHGRLSRQRAEELVFKAGLDGSFVVRASESIMGAYALSVLHGGSIHTYRILPTDSGLLAVQTINGVQQRKFTSISELITAYRSPQNGLVCGLTNPVGPTSDKPSLAPPPAVATPVPTRGDAIGWFPANTGFNSGTPTAEPPRPVLPVSSLPVSSLPQTQPRSGVRVMLDDKMFPPQRGRELPPVPPPNRDAPQRPAAKVVPPPSGSNSTIALEIHEKLKERVKSIAGAYPNIGSSFIDQLQQYCNDNAKQDIDGVLNNGSQCAEMQKLLAKEAGNLQKELGVFLLKISALRQLFDVQSAVTREGHDPRSDRDVDLESFLTRLGDCKNTVKHLDKRISITIKEQAGMEVESLYGTALRTSSTSSTRRSHSVPEYNFEVKVDSGLKQTKAKLQVNVQIGRLVVMKGEDIQKFTQDQVLQIIKNHKSRSKLSLVYEGGKKREYLFENSGKREAFCQVMQLLRNMHSNNTEPDFVSIFIGAWNMGDAMPPVDIRSWFRCGGSGRTLDQSVCDISHDIYAIGTQETGLPEKEWLHKVTETISEITGKKLHIVAMDALWHIKIILLVKEEHKNRISHVQTSSVKTGIANTLGNKGAVAVSFQFGGTSLCFINAHLTSGNEKCTRRNQNYHDIMRSLNLGHDRCSMFDLTNRFDHLFFLGDLNYRLEMDVHNILEHIKKRDLSDLYKVDQLRREKELNKVFYDFSEDEIAFQPTYRYERGTREAYSHLKIKRTGIRINVPSWCDRVLWKSYPETHNVCHAYGCSDDIMTSDHSPVFFNIQVGVRGQYVSNEGLKSGNPDSAMQPATIKFESIEAILKASGKSNFYLQFHSTCLAREERTSSSTKFNTSEIGQNCVRVIWDNLPELRPIISDREYLVDQHLLVLVKGEDDNDAYAEFVLALRSMIGTCPQKFNEHLTRKGEDAGRVQGSMHVKTRDSTLSRKEKEYDFIQFGKREEVEPVLYSDAPEPTSRDPTRSSMLSNVASKIAGMTSKIGSNLQPKVTKAAPPQSWSRSVDTRPPMAAPTPPPQQFPHESQHIQPVTYGETYQRAGAPPSGGISPQKNKQNSPTFPAKFPHNRPTSDPPTLDLSGLPIHTNSSTPSPSNLDAVIAEFEAAGSLFEALTKQENESMPHQNHDSSPRHSQPNLWHSTDARQALPSFNNTAPRQPGFAPPSRAPVNQSYTPPLQSRTVIGQSSTPPLQSRTVIGQSSGSYSYSRNMIGHGNPVLPPPSGPAPQLPNRGKSLQLAGVTTPIVSIQDMMSRLGLSQYTTALTDSGWDNLEFLSDITDADLQDCGIVNEDHRRSILSCVENMDYAEQPL
uniref:phosphatidylinositol 3,4,5-trisphosphate 5-phosphatase 2-like n=1 Tax=Styela clava TaxID=7725 RepID=UPI001939E4AD|nr:phosphatidylinositol 3,4,5-trisphosphate 5-phosphatase 2-like [Styela clava]